MSLSARTRLGSYEITAALGAGGMGDVYRARDIRDYPTWSPDGRRVFFSVSRKSGDLYVLEGF